jgi:HK97 family phage prohead protease
MPWDIVHGHKGCPSYKPWAVVKKGSGELVACHESWDKARKQQQALYAKEGQMSSTHAADCGCADHAIGYRAVDNSAWDGPAAMSDCAKSDTPASCYQSICAGRKAGDPSKQATWALPHHKTPGAPPNAAGVRAALGRLSQTDGLTNAGAAKAHLNAHMAAIQAGEKKSADHGHDHVHDRVLPVRGYWRDACRYRDTSEGAGVLGLMQGHFAVFNQWTEILSFWEGEFMERILPGAFADTFRDERDAMQVLFQHGRDPQIGSKVLGPIQTLREDDTGAFYEVPLYDTTYNRDLVPPLRDGRYGASFRFEATEDTWVKKPERSDYNPTGLPERSIVRASVLEFGPVTFPAYAGATAGLRMASLRSGRMCSLTDLFCDLDDHDAGRLAAWSRGGGDSHGAPGNGRADDPEAALRARDRALRIRGVIRP